MVFAEVGMSAASGIGRTEVSGIAGYVKRQCVREEKSRNLQAKGRLEDVMRKVSRMKFCGRDIWQQEGKSKEKQKN